MNIDMRYALERFFTHPTSALETTCALCGGAIAKGDAVMTDPAAKETTPETICHRACVTMPYGQLLDWKKRRAHALSHATPEPDAEQLGLFSLHGVQPKERP